MPNGRMKLKIKKFLLNIATALFLLISFSVNALTMREKNSAGFIKNRTK